MIVYDIFLDIPARIFQVCSPEKIPPELLAVGLQHALLHACSIPKELMRENPWSSCKLCLYVSSYKNCLWQKNMCIYVSVYRCVYIINIIIIITIIIITIIIITIIINYY